MAFKAQQCANTMRIFCLSAGVALIVCSILRMIMFDPIKDFTMYALSSYFM